MTGLAGKVAVITGAGRPDGLGAAIARRLARDGCRVVLSDVTDDVDATAAAIQSETEAARCDVRDAAQVDALAETAVRRFGALDIWVNNAGIGYLMKPLAEVSASDWAAVIDVNLTGSFNGIQAAAARMVARGRGGRIVNVASQAAKSGFPFAAAYCASKHGLVGLVRSVAIELGPHGITVNNVCPNHVTTGLGAWQNDYFSKQLGMTLDQYMQAMRDRIPMRRAGLPEDTANAVAWLCSDDAAYVTAESLNVSGGEEPH